MTTFSNESVTCSVLCSHDEYWVDGKAAAAVLLVDQAAEAITEALHRVRTGSVLDDQDLAAAGIALGDLMGGLGQLADLLTESAGRYAGAAPLEVGRLTDWLDSLRATTLDAQQAARGVQLASAAIGPLKDTG